LSETDWQGKGPLVVKLVKGLRELRADLEEHVQLETNVLFPAMRELGHSPVRCMAYHQVVVRLEIGRALPSAMPTLMTGPLCGLCGSKGEQPEL
jgi:hypothetical protein